MRTTADLARNPLFAAGWLVGRNEPLRAILSQEFPDHWPVMTMHVGHDMVSMFRLWDQFYGDNLDAGACQIMFEHKADPLARLAMLHPVARTRVRLLASLFGPVMVSADALHTLSRLSTGLDLINDWHRLVILAPAGTRLQAVQGD